MQRNGHRITWLQSGRGFNPHFLSSSGYRCLCACNASLWTSLNTSVSLARHTHTCSTGTVLSLMHEAQSLIGHWSSESQDHGAYDYQWKRRRLDFGVPELWPPNVAEARLTSGNDWIVDIDWLMGGHSSCDIVRFLLNQRVKCRSLEGRGSLGLIQELQRDHSHRWIQMDTALQRHFHLQIF